LTRQNNGIRKQRSRKKDFNRKNSDKNAERCTSPGKLHYKRDISVAAAKALASPKALERLCK